MLRIHGNKFKHLAGLSYAGLAGSSAVFLLILAAMLFAPAAAQPEASAVEDNSGISIYAATPTVSISLPTSIDFADVLPTPSGATTTATADLTITTTDSAGYSLYLYSSDGDNSLRPKISSLANISTINATAGDVGLTLSSLKPNTWGYNLGTEAPTDATTYSAVPTDNSTPIQTKDTSNTNTANDTYTLSFGAKVDTTTASGTYSDALTIAVVAEPPKIPFEGITTMQAMTTDICDNADENETTRLMDIRDNKYYWVAKLKDGNCWMTQNLDFDLNMNQTLTSNDSDVANNWTPPDSTSVTIFNEGAIWGSSFTLSWDPGEYVLSTPLSGVSCGGSDSNVTDLSECSGSGFVNVENMVAMTTIQQNDSVVNGREYDAHYHVGNYYQFGAAVAESSKNYDEAEESICPAGWQIGTAGPEVAGNHATDSNVYLSLAKNYTTFDPYGSGSINDSILSFPLYFLRSGYVAGGSLVAAGSYGSYWSSTGYSSFDAVAVSFGAKINTGSQPNRYEGYSVRCLAK